MKDMKRYQIFFLFSFFSLALCSSCAFKQPVNFTVTNVEEGGILYGFSKTSVEGVISLAKEGQTTFEFEQLTGIPADSSIELAYSISGAFNGSVSFKIEGDGATVGNWILPADASIVTDKTPSAIRFAVPANAPRFQKISISVSRNAKPSDDEKDSFLCIQSLGVTKRWFGFSWEDGEFLLTPFVQEHASYSGNQTWLIDPPPEYRSADAVVFSAGAFYDDSAERTGGEDTIIVEPGEIFFEWKGPYEKGNALHIPPGMLPPNPYPLLVSISSAMGMARLESSTPCVFPLEPIRADPGIALAYREGDWRDSRYEVFQWEGFPSILIFDTANYDVQNNMFRRLAFFVEKEGYRGKLLSDKELEGMHGWNAHDYRAEDLAVFFDRAETSDFPLLPEERELCEILFANDILKRESNGKISPGTGAVISVSRSSSDTLRAQFMAHEGFHGLFFIDEDFRTFTKNRYNDLTPVARNFLHSFLDYQNYDIADSYLVLNEFQAYVLQQSEDRAYWYFGGNLAARLEASPWRRALLPKKDEYSGTWPVIGSAFETEAKAFSAYVYDRWGFSAGRDWRVTVK